MSFDEAGSAADVISSKTIFPTSILFLSNFNNQHVRSSAASDIRFYIWNRKAQTRVGAIFMQMLRFSGK